MIIELRTIFLIVYIFSFFIHGLFSELIMLSSTLLLVLLERKKIINNIGKKVYNAAVLFIAFYSFMFVVLTVSENVGFSVVRLYGMTKSIVTPAIILITLQDYCKKRNSLLIIFILMLAFNVIYFSNLFIHFDNDTIWRQLGSYNACTGISVVMLPAALYFAKLMANKTIQKVLGVLFIALTIVFIFMSNSTTSIILLSIQIVIYVFSIFRPIQKKKGGKICFYIVLALLIITLLIATGQTEMRSSDLKTRVGIWTTMYSTFTSLNVKNLLFGTGNDIVQMLNKSLEPHNAFLEILMIYGMIGLGFFAFYIILVFRRLTTISMTKKIYVWTTIITYSLVCFLHPFFTGLPLFQVTSTMCIIYLVNRNVYCNVGFLT